MPGGYGRIGRTQDAAAIALQRGGSVSDVWVISDKPVRNETMLPSPASPYVRSQLPELPSRAADNLFWMGRYVERTEGLVRLMRNPPGVQTLMVAFESEAAACTAVSAVIAAGLLPATMDMMDQRSMRMSHEFMGAAIGLPVHAGAALIVDVDGYAAGLDAQIEEVADIFANNGGYDIRIAQSEAERVAAASGNPPSGGSTSAADHEEPAPSATLPAAPEFAPNEIRAHLYALLLDMRARQPSESGWQDHPELRRLRSDVDHLTTIVSMCVELVTRREAA